MSLLFTQSLTAFLFTLLMLSALARAAPAVGLVDTPDSRKLHQGRVPLVGGLSIFATLALGGALWGETATSVIAVRGNEALWVFMGCGAFLVVTGALDDKFHLGVFVRILSEMLVALIIIETLDLRLANLGDLFGFGEIKLHPAIAYPFTAFAMFGVINAFNMLDGIDGLLASLVLTTLITFHLFTETVPGFFSLFIGASLLAFLVSNLELSPHVPKTFLGDAGSKLLGFIVVCLLLAAASTQVGGNKLIKSVTALFLLGIPLFDMVHTSLRRITMRKSPFVADRTHIHHLLQALGFSNRRSLLLILSVSLFITFVGLMLHRSNAPESYQLAIFLSCFALYSLLVTSGWVIARKMRDANIFDNAEPWGDLGSKTPDD